MAKDPAFLFYPGDYLRDTQCLSEKAQVAYDRIMCEHMRNTSLDMCNISVSKERVEFFIKKLTADEKHEIYHVLTEIGSGFQIEWVAESICKRKSYSESRAKNRSKKEIEDIKTYDNHMENENENINEVDSKNKEGVFPIKKNPKKYPVSSDFNGLPQNQFYTAILGVRNSEGITITEDQVKDFWENFKGESLTGKNYYEGVEAVYTHFQRWIKKQKIHNGTKKFNGGTSSNGKAISGTSVIAADKKYSGKL